MSIHPQVIEKDGRKEFVVLPYEEFLQMQEEIEDYQDLKTLRDEKASAHSQPTRSLDAVLKAIKGEWNRPVAMSETQFQLADTERERFSLYVVEYAGDASKRKLHRVNDPAGIAKYFCFDSGWSEVAKHQNP